MNQEPEHHHPAHHHHHHQHHHQHHHDYVHLVSAATVCPAFSANHLRTAACTSWSGFFKANHNLALSQIFTNYARQHHLLFIIYIIITTNIDKHNKMIIYQPELELVLLSCQYYHYHHIIINIITPSTLTSKRSFSPSSNLGLSWCCCLASANRPDRLVGKNNLRVIFEIKVFQSSKYFRLFCDKRSDWVFDYPLYYDKRSYSIKLLITRLQSLTLAAIADNCWKHTWVIR